MRNLFLIMLTFLFSFTAFAGNGICVSGDCADGYGSFEFEKDYLNRNLSPIVYTGDFKDIHANNSFDERGWRHGYGVCAFADGSSYKGNWKNDYMEGEGRMTYEDGSYYQGKWRGSQRHGIGKMRYPDGKVVEGLWKYGKLEQRMPKLDRGNWLMSSITVASLYVIAGVSSVFS